MRVSGFSACGDDCGAEEEYVNMSKGVFAFDKSRPQNLFCAAWSCVACSFDCCTMSLSRTASVLTQHMLNTE